MNHVQEWDGVDDLEWLVQSSYYVDAIDKSPCPRCKGSQWDLDCELHAWVCEDCGLWLDSDDDL